MDLKEKKIWFWLVAIIVGFCGWDLFISLRSQDGSQAPAPVLNVGTYNPHKICDDAYERKEDHYAEETVNHYDVKLSNGCFGPFFRPPRSWHTWEYQPLGDTSTFWLAMWYPGWEPMGPWGANKKPEINSPPSAYWRMQGNGTVRIYSNDVVP